MKIKYLFSLPLAALLLSACASDNAPKQANAAAQQCRPTSEAEIAGLFDRWNNSLKTGDPAKVAANYAPDSVLLPTVSNKVRYDDAQKRDYFAHFLENRPVGEINERRIKIGCNSALDAGIYTFTFGTTGQKVSGRYSYTYEWNGSQWLISSHHSSVMPEADGKAAH